MILETVDPPAEGPYAAGCAAAEIQGWERCLRSGSIQCGRACQKAKLHFLDSCVSVPESERIIILSGFQGPERRVAVNGGNGIDKVFDCQHRFCFGFGIFASDAFGENNCSITWYDIN